MTELPPITYTTSELLAVMSSRLLQDGQVVFAGVGVPLLAATLAQRSHGPGLTILFEGGALGPFIVPNALPPSPNEQRAARRSNMILSITDIMLMLQRGYVDFGFMGGAQIDRFGNLNSSYIGDVDNPSVRLPGSGGGNDISSLTRLIVAMKHEKRRFVEKVDFVTSPGFLTGGESRTDAGLVTGGLFRVVTDLAILGFDTLTKEMKVEALHPGVSAEQVRDNTGFDIKIDSVPAVSRAPTTAELEVLRHLDANQIYTA